MSKQIGSQGYAISSRFLVSPDPAQGYYTTIQEALNDANTAGGGTILVKPGIYTENLTGYDNTQIVGIDSSVQNGNIFIIGVHTPPSSGQFSFSNIILQSATDLFYSNAAGSADLIINNCVVFLTNGYIFNLANWTGLLKITTSSEGSTTNGIANNTGGSAIDILDSTIGSGATSMVTSGVVTITNSTIECPINPQTGSTLNANGCNFNAAITFSNNSTGNIYQCNFSTGSTASITQSSSGALNVSQCTINCTANPAIAGLGSGTCAFDFITFINSGNTVASTLTLNNLTVNYIGGNTNIQTIDAGAAVTLEVRNLDVSGNAGSNAIIGITTDSGGDPYLNCSLTGTSENAYFGIDRSDSFKLKIGGGASGPSSGDTYISCDPNGDIVVTPFPASNGNVQLTPDGTGKMILGKVAGNTVSNLNLVTINTITGELGSEAGSGSGFIQTITGNTGGAESPSAGNFNILGTGSITVAGSANTETVQLTGLTNHNVLVGAGTATITNVAPSTSGFVLTSNGASADPSFQAPAASSISITGDSGGALTGNSFTIYANNSASNAGKSVSFSGSGTTLTFNVTDSNDNTFIGFQSGSSSSGSTNNTALGYQSLSAVTAALGGNVAIGWRALQHTNTGVNNTALGLSAGETITSAQSNVAIGRGSLGNALSGYGNVCIGQSAGSAYTGSEGSNIIIGTDLTGTLGESHVIRIGQSGSGDAQQNKCFIAGINGVTPGATYQVAVNDTNGQFGTIAQTNGELLIGSTGANPVASTLSAGTGISISNGAGSITISSTGSSMAWTDKNISFSAASGNGYFVTGTAAGTLPASPSQGDVISFIVDTTNILTVTANTGQFIRIGSAISSSAGTAANNARGDSLTLVYRSSDTTWCARDVIGTWTTA